MVKVSVIVPVYNGENYIEECVKNLLTQSLKEIEIILVNDGSNDNTDLICTRLMKQDRRIRYYKQCNKGAGIARNLGIKKSQGNYICFIDCDDEIKSNYLELLYETAINKKSEIVICNIISIDENKKVLSEKVLKEGKYNSVETLKELFQFKDLNAGPCGKLFKRCLFNKGLKFQSVRVYEDLLFCFKAINLSSKIYSINNCNYYYIHRKGIGTMYMYKQLPSLDVIIVSNEILDSLKANFYEIWDTSFYGIISQVAMYIPCFKNNKKYKDEYLKMFNRVLKKYRIEILTNKSMGYKEKLAYILASYSGILYGKLY